MGKRVMEKCRGYGEVCWGKCSVGGGVEKVRRSGGGVGKCVGRVGGSVEKCWGGVAKCVGGVGKCVGVWMEV